MNDIVEKVKQLKILPVVVIKDIADVEPTLKALWDGGLPVAENTDIHGGKLNHNGYKSVAKQLADTMRQQAAVKIDREISGCDTQMPTED